MCHAPRKFSERVLYVTAYMTGVVRSWRTVVVEIVVWICACHAKEHVGSSHDGKHVSGPEVG